MGKKIPLKPFLDFKILSAITIQKQTVCNFGSNLTFQGFLCLC